MDSEFPDPDEEFDLVATDDYLANKNVADPVNRGEASQQRRLTQSQREISKASKNKVFISNGISRKALNEDEFPDPDEEFDLIEAGGNEASEATVADTIGVDGSAERTKKRTFDELFGDIQDLLQEDLQDIRDMRYEYVERKDKKPRWDQPKLVIEAIRNERKKIQDKYEIDDGTSNGFTSTQTSQKSNSISTRVPSWNFVAVTRTTDCQRLYVRVRPDRKFDAAKIKPTSGFLSVSYSQLKEEADKIIIENVKRASLPVVSSTQRIGDDSLWVDKYRPKTYMELLSDETVNRDFLRWLKLWDKVVFHRESTRKKKPTKTTFNNSRKFGWKQEEEETVDKRGFPIHRIALLSGPPGLGKTTLAHIVAKHAGYNVVEINASDDRGPEAFREALLSSTQMKSMIGADPRPNCLVLDEIDGAPAASIDLLIKFVQGKLMPKGRKAKDTSGKSSEYCKRPIVCICNEAYTPSLRPLRAMAYNVNVSKVSASSLTDRLMMIARKEKIRVSQGTLLQLAERSGCDIRTCLGALQYMGEDCEKSNMSLGTKDTKKGLFESWREMLQIPMKRSGPLAIRERVQMILNTAHNDSSERLAQGVFENYPPNCHDKMDKVSSSLEWFQFYDKITTTVMTKNDWRIMPYTNYAFVSWHLGFAGPKNPKLSYPYVAMEANQKVAKTRALLIAAQRSCVRDIQTITLDIAPCLFELLTPRLRAVAVNLYVTKEKAELERLINVMLDLGLTFVQERKEDGTLDYQIEPNLLEIGIFPGCKVRRSLLYATKQIISHELEVERLKRAVITSGITTENLEKPATEKKTVESGREIPSVMSKTNGPLHMNVEPIIVPPKERKFRNYFASFKLPPKAQESSQSSPKQPSPKAESPGKKMREIISKYGVWFKYKEGYSNAIRRTVKIKDIL